MELKEIYQNLVETSLKKDVKAIDCLLHPELHPPIWKFESCDACGDCEQACAFQAIERGGDGNVRIKFSDCVGCGDCLLACESRKLSESRELVAVLKAIAEGKTVYALVAPAFFSQFDASVGQMRTVLKRMGFSGMLEIALFADVLTLKESMEFLEMDRSDFMLASCCCPVWIAMIRKMFGGFVSHIPPSVSPMIAGGKTVKQLYENCVTVFLSPCLAKKAEAREPDVAGNVDYVLTFDEIRYLLDLLKLDPHEAEEDVKDNTSRLGRLYARSGGVSEAVGSTVDALDPGREHRSAHACGVAECRALLTRLKEGGKEAVGADYIEGMGCRFGCVGGPKTILDPETATERTDALADEAPFSSPKDNPFVFKLLHELGLDSLEKLRESGIFSRKF